jgi:3-methylcrotonyl-CoA carboxylase beta subunit
MCGKSLPVGDVEQVLDASIPLPRLVQVAALGMHDEAPPGGIIAGIGRLHDRQCVVVASDAIWISDG